MSYMLSCMARTFPLVINESLLTKQPFILQTLFFYFQIIFADIVKSAVNIVKKKKKSAVNNVFTANIVKSAVKTLNLSKLYIIKKEKEKGIASVEAGRFNRSS